MRRHDRLCRLICAFEQEGILYLLGLAYPVPLIAAGPVERAGQSRVGARTATRSARKHARDWDKRSSKTAWDGAGVPGDAAKRVPSRRPRAGGDSAWTASLRGARALIATGCKVRWSA